MMFFFFFFFFSRNVDIKKKFWRGTLKRENSRGAQWSICVCICVDEYSWRKTMCDESVAWKKRHGEQEETGVLKRVRKELVQRKVAVFDWRDSIQSLLRVCCLLFKAISTIAISFLNYSIYFSFNIALNWDQIKRLSLLHLLSINDQIFDSYIFK